MKIYEFLATIADLRLIQIIFRLKNFFYQKFFSLPRQINNHSLPEEIRPLQKSPITVKSGSIFLNEKSFWFVFGNQQINAERIYEHLDYSLLFNYHFSYLEFLNQKSLSPDDGELLLGYWQKNWSHRKGRHWDAYPTSRRLVSIIKFYSANGDLEINITELKKHQYRILETLEFHLLGNHLLINLKALILVYCVFDDCRSAQFKKICRLFDAQLDEQFLKDGGHFERSPMYHSHCTEDLLDVYNALGRLSDPDESIWLLKRKIQSKIEKALFWFSLVSHSDEVTSCFNDTRLDYCHSLIELCDYANLLGIKFVPPPIHHLYTLTESGFFVFSRDSIKLIVDIGSCAPVFLPGHSRAGTFSYELSIGGNRMIVNTEIGIYEIGNRRILERSTRRHSAAEIDGKNSSYVWSSFRVGTKAKALVQNLSYANDLQSFTLDLTHKGYSRPWKTALSHRSFVWRGNTLEVIDQISKRLTLKSYILIPGHLDLRFSDEKSAIKIDGGVVTINSDKFKYANKIQTGSQFGERKTYKRLVYGDNECNESTYLIEINKV